MKKALLICCFIIVVFSSSVSAQMLSPVVDLKGTLNEGTYAFFAGKTNIRGNFAGYQVDFLLDNPLFYDIAAFPLIGKNSFENIDNVAIVEIGSINFTSLSDVIDLDDLEAVEFSDVDIVADGGPFLLGTDQGRLTIREDIPFALSSIISLNIEQVGRLKFLIMASIYDLEINYLGDTSYLIQNSNTSDIKIFDSEGNEIWRGDSNDYIFIINDGDFKIIQDSAVNLFPLITNQTYESMRISISPSDFNSDILLSIFSDFSNSNIEFGEISDFSDKILEFESIITPLSSMINGCMVLLNSNETFIIDDTSQIFSNIVFARATSFDVTLSPSTHTPIISGDYKLIFLGDHLYSTQAKYSDTGVTLPIIFIVIWIIAIVLLILFKFYFERIKKYFIKKEIDEPRDLKIKNYIIIFHIIFLILAFILMDREISFQFGFSAIDAIIGQGLSLISLAFIAVELVIWIMGFFILAIPIRIIVNSVIRIFGFGKEVKGFGKGIGALGIWIFCAFYVKLIINIIFLIINPNSLFPM